jgi:hypothetical protein
MKVKGILLKRSSNNKNCSTCGHISKDKTKRWSDSISHYCVRNCTAVADECQLCVNAKVDCTCPRIIDPITTVCDLWEQLTGHYDHNGGWR